MNILLLAEQFRRALQIIASGMTETQALEVPSIFEPYEVDRQYKVGEYFSYGKNKVGDPQLYKVVQDHKSQANWTPDITSSLYTPIGLDESGIPVWSQPTGSHDAYNTGDIVNYNGVIYRSIIDGNTHSPDTYPDGWEVVE